MKISSRGRYGIRFMIDLAEQGFDKHVTLASSAERQGVSLRYLEQVAVILRRAGFLRSVKGAAGGYALAKPATEVSVGDVLRALEGDVFVVDPPRYGVTETKLHRCVRLTVFDRLNRLVAEVVDSKMIASLIGTVDPEDSYLYFI
jgi:Rrf2 family protein